MSPGTNWLAVDPGLGLVWALASVDGHNPAALNALTEINAVAGTTTTMSLAGIAAGFAGLAVNTVSHELYLLGGLGDVYTVSETSPAVPTAPFISTGQSSPYGMAIADDPVTGNIWVSADQDAHGFSASGASLGAPVALPGDPASLTVDSRTGTVWAAAAQSVSAFAEKQALRYPDERPGRQRHRAEPGRRTGLGQFVSTGSAERLDPRGPGHLSGAEQRRRLLRSCL